MIDAMGKQAWLVMGLSEDVDGSYREYPRMAFQSEEEAQEELSERMDHGRIVPITVHGDDDD